MNNAGITGRSFPIQDLTDDDWHKVIACDLTSVFFVCRAAIRHMLTAGGGRIINIASIAGKEGNPTLVPYSDREGRRDRPDEGARQGSGDEQHLRERGRARRDRHRPAQADGAVHGRLLVSKIPMGRVGTPHEVAALVAWLASDECSFSTGAVYDLSGGRASY